MHVSVPHVHSTLLGEKRMFNHLGFDAYYELPYGYQELNQRTLGEHMVLSAAEPSFQHHFGFYFYFSPKVKICTTLFSFLHVQREDITDMLLTWFFQCCLADRYPTVHQLKFFRLSPISISLHLCYFNASSSSAHPNTIFLFTHKHLSILAYFSDISTSLNWASFCFCC